MSAPSATPRFKPDEDEPPLQDTGPFRASQLRDGDPYELSNGHPILCMGAGDRHGNRNAKGARVLDTDPKVAQEGGAGVDVAYEFNDGKNLRAPDISVGNLKGKPGWAQGVPVLAVEYADRGQNEKALKAKIRELLAAGTQHLWVVRLVGPLRVEVHRPGKRMRVVPGDGQLTAPGVLQNPVPVQALVDQGAANQATLRNILNQLGYDSIDEVYQRGERAGRQEGSEQAVLAVCAALQIPVTPARRAQLGRLDAPALADLCARLARTRAWPRKA